MVDFNYFCREGRLNGGDILDLADLADQTYEPLDDEKIERLDYASGHLKSCSQCMSEYASELTLRAEMKECCLTKSYMDTLLSEISRINQFRGVYIC